MEKEEEREGRVSSLETLSTSLLHSVNKITIVGNSTLDSQAGGELSRSHKILLWTGVTLLGLVFLFFLYRLCWISSRRAFGMGGRRKNKREETLNKILSNSGAREVLRSRALTAINSQANRRVHDFASHNSVDTIGSVPDISDRVVRVSFALVERDTVRDYSAMGETVSIGGESLASQPPPYDTLSTPPPPQYSELSGGRGAREGTPANSDKGTKTGPASQQ